MECQYQRIAQHLQCTSVEDKDQARSQWEGLYQRAVKNPWHMIKERSQSISMWEAQRLAQCPRSLVEGGSGHKSHVLCSDKPQQTGADKLISRPRAYCSKRQRTLTSWRLGGGQPPWPSRIERIVKGWKWVFLHFSLVHQSCVGSLEKGWIPQGVSP